MAKINLKAAQIKIGDKVFFSIRKVNNFHQFWEVVALEKNGKVRVKALGEIGGELIIDHDNIQKHIPKGTAE